MTLDEQLKALTDSELGDLTQDSGLLGVSVVPDSSLTRTPLAPPSAPDENLVRNVEIALEFEGHREILAKNAWKCSRCGTVNGLVAGKKVARKSCKKCLKLRTDECLLIEELVK